MTRVQFVSGVERSDLGQGTSVPDKLELDYDLVLECDLISNPNALPCSFCIKRRVRFRECAPGSEWSTLSLPADNVDDDNKAYDEFSVSCNQTVNFNSETSWSYDVYEQQDAYGQGHYVVNVEIFESCDDEMPLYQDARTFNEC